MAISIESAKKLQYLWREENTVEWIETFIKIADKESNIVPFKLTGQQKEFIRNKSKNNIILKSRQLGFSLVVCALSIRQCIVKPYSNCLLMSADQKSATEIFDKLKIMYDNLPKFLKIKAKANNRSQLKLENGSKITCACEGRTEIIGATNMIVHLSEFSRWANPQKQLSSIQKTVVADGLCVIESTARGYNTFSELWFKSKNNENDFNPFFFGWITGRELFEKDYLKAVERYKAIYNKELSDNELDEEELGLLDIGATLDQLMWRRLEIAQDGIDLFHQERPSYDTQAFIATGKNIFSNTKINQVELSLKKNNYIKQNKIIDLPILLKKYYGKSFFMWKIPKKSDKYFVGVDASEGVGGDFHVVQIFNQEGIQCAEFFNNKLKPYQMSEIINCIGRYYNKAILTIEKASGGLPILERLREDYKYYNMSKYKTFDEKNRVKYTPGFDTNTKNKGYIINDFIEMFETGQIQINSKRLLDEMKVFEVKDNGSMSAINGFHDDEVMSCALALFGLKKGIQYKM